MSGFRFTIPALAFDGTYPALAIEVVPDKGFSTGVTPRVLKAQFGDGYQQRVADGINPINSTFSMAFVKRPRAEIDNIEKYFELLGAVTPLEITVSDHTEGVADPNERTMKALCNSWNKVWLFDEYYSLTANLERYYGPT